MNSVVTRLGVSGILTIMGLMLTPVSHARINPEDIAAMWLFDEVEKDVTKDLSGNLHHAKLVNNPELVEGKFGKAFAFGKGKYLEVPHHRKLQIKDVITISVWVKRPLRQDANDIAEAPFYIMDKGGNWGFGQQGQANYGIALHKILKNMFFFFFRGGFRGVEGIPDDQWHHYVAVAKHNEADPKIYIDGIPREIALRDGEKRIALFPDSKRNLHIGALIPERFDSYSENVIDELIIFNAALNEAEVIKLKSGIANTLFAVSASGKLATTWGNLKRGW